MLMAPIPLFLAATTMLAPLGAGQQARLAAWLSWAVAYRECYKPASFSLKVDETLTARCIESTLREQRSLPPEERAAIDALIAATPYLIGLLNSPAGEEDGSAAAGSDPQTSPAQPGASSAAPRPRP